MFLAHSTKVLLPNGTEKPIDEVKEGDVLQGADGENKVIKAELVPAPDSLWELNGNIVVDAGQPFLNEHGNWTAVSEPAAVKSHPYLDCTTMRQGDGLVTFEGVDEAQFIQSHLAEGQLCIELTLDGDNTFFANGYLVHNKGGGGGGTTIQKSEPPEYLEPYLTDIAQRAQQAYGQVPQGGFSGQLIATPTTAQQQGIQGTKDVAASLGGFGQQTQAIADQQAQNVLSGAYTQRADNTFTPTNLATEGAIQAYLDPVQRRLQEQIIPQLTGQAVSAGAYGGDRFAQEAARQVNEGFTREAANIAAQLGYGEGVRQDQIGFENFLANQELFPELLKLEQTAALTVPELANQSVQQQLLPSQLFSQAGTQEQLFNQDVLDEAYQQYILSTQTPFAGLDQYASIVGGIPGGGVSTTTGSGGGGSNFISGALGGGLAAYGLSSAVPALSFLGGVPGIAGAAILGGLLG